MYASVDEALEAVGLSEQPVSQENGRWCGRTFVLVQEGFRRGDPGAGFDECVVEGVVAADLAWRGKGRGLSP